MIFYTEYASPLGTLTLSSDGMSLCGLWLPGQKYFMASLSERPEKNNSLSVFSDAREWLDSYFAGDRPGKYSHPLSPSGTPFRKSVWNILLDIPYGETVTYGEIAKKILSDSGKPASARAVGGAVAHNPISIIIPCHRVIGANGSLTGYAGGIDAKLRLLRHEKHE